jgi:hypothetical protein
MSIVNSARAWVDESQLVMPGYRDRVVTIFHDKAEGGMNLRMPQPVVLSLAERGRGGAAQLVRRFAGDLPGIVPAKGWDNQRWIRLRTATAGLDTWLAGFRAGYSHDAAGTTSYADLAGPQTDQTLPANKTLTVDRLTAVNKRTQDLLFLAAEWASTPTDAFTYDAPTPRPRLRLAPGERLEDTSPLPAPATRARAQSPSD